MSRGLRRQAPALMLSCLALIASLGGTVYAAARLNGHRIKPKSLPGNRLALHSLPGNRLKLGAIPGSSLAPGSITGIQVDAATLGQVPSAYHADTADSAHDAETALVAVEANSAKKVNGYEAGCRSGTRPFAGACWQAWPSEVALAAPDAAAACASQGGELPDALSLVAYSKQPGVTFSAGDEWSGDVAVVSGPDSYAVATVSPSGEVHSSGSTAGLKFHCVIPLVG